MKSGCRSFWILFKSRIIFRVSWISSEFWLLGSFRKWVLQHIQVQAPLWHESHSAATEDCHSVWAKKGGMWGYPLTMGTRDLVCPGSWCPFFEPDFRWSPFFKFTTPPPDTSTLCLRIKSQKQTKTPIIPRCFLIGSINWDIRTPWRIYLPRNF